MISFHRVKHFVCTEEYIDIRQHPLRTVCGRERESGRGAFLQARLKTCLKELLCTARILSIVSTISRLARTTSRERTRNLVPLFYLSNHLLSYPLKSTLHCKNHHPSIILSIIVLWWTKVTKMTEKLPDNVSVEGQLFCIKEVIFNCDRKDLSVSFNFFITQDVLELMILILIIQFL